MDSAEPAANDAQLNQTLYNSVSASGGCVSLSLSFGNVLSQSVRKTLPKSQTPKRMKRKSMFSVKLQCVCSCSLLSALSAVCAFLCALFSLCSVLCSVLCSALAVFCAVRCVLLLVLCNLCALFSLCAVLFVLPSVLYALSSVLYSALGDRCSAVSCM